MSTNFEISIPKDFFLKATLVELYKVVRRREDWDEQHPSAKKIMDAFRDAGNSPPPYKLLAGVSLVAQPFFDRNPVDLEMLRARQEELHKAVIELTPFIDVLDTEIADQDTPFKLIENLKEDKETGLSFQTRNMDLKVFQCALALLQHIDQLTDNSGLSTLPKEAHYSMRTLLMDSASFVEDFPIVTLKPRTP